MTQTGNTPKPALASASASAPKSPGTGKAGLVVFVLEEDAGVRDLITKIAQDEGCQVVSGANGSDTPVRIRSAQPCIVFLSLSENDRNFTATCRAAQGANAVALIVTAENPSRRHVLLAYQCGAIDFLVKPAGSYVVLQKVLDGMAFVAKMFKSGSNALAMVAGDKETAAGRLERIKAHAKDIMVIPHAATRVISECDNSKTDAKRLTSVARLDPVLSSALIRRANSALFGGARVASIEGAIVRLGFRMVRSIATLLSAFKLTETQTVSSSFDRFGLWVHTLGTGIIAQKLASRAGGAGRPEDCFLAGILHDFGKLFFDDYLHKEYLAVNDKAAGGEGLEGMEKAAFGINHSEMGDFMARRWNLPEFVATAIAQHHSINLSADDVAVNTSSVVCAADMMAKTMLIGRSNNPDQGFLPDKFWSRLNIAPHEMDAFVREVFDEVKELADLLRIPSGRVPFSYVPPRPGAVAQVEDGDRIDRLFDVFLHSNGWQVRRGASDGRVPTAVIHDLRRGAPSAPTPTLASVRRQIVLRTEDLPLPDYITPDARVVSSSPCSVFLLQALGD